MLLAPLIALAIVLGPLAWRAWRTGSVKIRLSLAVLAVTWAWACDDVSRPSVVVTPAEAPTDRPIEVPIEGFVTSDTCQACHPAEYGSWRSSYHRTMTQEVGPDTVLAPFDDVELQLYDQTFRLERRGDEYWVELDDPAWEGEGPAPRVWRQIVLSTGSHTFQAYWYATGKSRKLGLFLMCYRIDAARWMPVDAAFVIPPEVEFETDKGRWNRDCQRCHTTQTQPRIRGPEDIDTHLAEFSIACEVCHGPADEHVASNRDPKRRYAMHLGAEVDPTIVNPATLGPKRTSMVCGQCHGITTHKNDKLARDWKETGYAFRAGENLKESRRLVTEGDVYFWPDGMVRVSGREYSALIQSPCYNHGDKERIMTCLSCHQLHRDEDDPRPTMEWANDQLALGMDGDQACLQCHADFASPERVAEHTHHRPGALGSACYDCHMPHTTWGLLKGIRSHEVSSPSVAETLDFGRPNACNLCHLDRTLAWTGEHLESWYGIETPELEPDQESVAASLLWLITGDAGQRALASWHLGWEPAKRASGSAWMAPYLGLLLEDPYAGVRFRAYASLRELEGFEDFEFDFLADEEARAAAHAAVLERWGSVAQTAARPTLLLDENGQRDAETFERLRALRDDRPVILAE